MPLSFPCGAAHTSNQPISNRIYNQLRKSAHKDQKRKQRQKEEKERSTAEKAVDENTRILLQKLINIGLGNVLVELTFAIIFKLYTLRGNLSKRFKNKNSSLPFEKNEKKCENSRFLFETEASKSQRNFRFIETKNLRFQIF